MDRRCFLVLCAGAGLAAGRGFAQGRPPRMGYLLLSPLREPPSQERQAFLDGLRDYGYVPGRTIDLVYRSAEGSVEFLEAMSQELVAQKPDLIVTSGAEATVAVRNATIAIPVVFLALGDPVGVGVVKSLARPGGNVTGVSFISADLAAKRVQLLREVAPAARRVAVLWDEGNRNAAIEAQAAMAVARKLGMTAQPAPLRSEPGIEAALQRIDARKPEALYIAFGQGAVAEGRTAIAEFGLRKRIPVVSGWSFMTDAGGLLSYAPDIPSMFRRGAHYVNRILRGARPAELPVEQATVIEMVVNARTARSIGIALPPAILVRANRVID